MTLSLTHVTTVGVGASPHTPGILENPKKQGIAALFERMPQ